MPASLISFFSRVKKGCIAIYAFRASDALKSLSGNSKSLEPTPSKKWKKN
jgi:hypothetical protein